MIVRAEIPVLLKGPLVRQFLAGRKTVTRRLDLAKWKRANPGDLIWFRETFLELAPHHWNNPCELKLHVYAPNRYNGLAYRADTDEVGDKIRKDYGYNWRPSIFMPKWAARCWAEIVSVREERLQEITDAEIKAEGVWEMGAGWPVSVFDGKAYGSERDLWIHVWDSINKKPGQRWDENPLVARIEFRRIER